MAPAAWLRRTFVPQGLRDWVKNRLTMRRRPVLSAELRARLEAEFDHDLARLGEWLGRPLTCANFKEITAAEVLDWVGCRGR